MIQICADRYRAYYTAPGTNPDPILCHRVLAQDGTRHRGAHQAVEYKPERPGDPDAAYEFQRTTHPAHAVLHTWGDGGGSSGRISDSSTGCHGCVPPKYGAGRWRPTHRRGDHYLRRCPECGILHDPTRTGRATDIIPADVPLTWCFGCGLWEGRARRYADSDTPLVRPHYDQLAHHPRLYSWSKVTGAFGGAQFRVTWDDGRTVGPRDTLWDAGAIPWWLLDRFPPNAHVDRGETVTRPGHTDPFGHPLTYTGHPPVGGR